MSPTHLRWCSSVLILGMSFSGGCRFLMDTAEEKPPIQAPPLKVTTRISPVHAEEISASNARSKAQLLLEEIEQDAGDK